MPEPTGGLIKVTLAGVYGGNRFNNVFYYWNSLDIEPVSFVAFLVNWNDSIIPGLASITNEIVMFNTITASTIFGTLPDLDLTPSILDGDLIGAASTSTVAMGFLYSPVTKEVNPGGKRFVGVTEANTNNNGWEAAFFSDLQAFALDLGSSIFDGANTYEAVVASRPKPTRNTWAVGELASITPYTTVRHQISRTPSAS